MGSREWCSHCFDRVTEGGSKKYDWSDKNIEFRTHSDHHHGKAEAEYIDAKDLRSGDLFWTNYRNQPQYMRCISARQSTKNPDHIAVVDSAHRSYSIPNTKRIQVQRIKDEYTIPEDE